MKHLRTFESNDNPEIIEEGIFKKVGEIFGIKGMDRRVEDYLGIHEDGFNPTSKAKIMINQGVDRNQLTTDDIDALGSALSKARKVGFGLSFWKDGCDLKEMEGTEEEKKNAKYLINRAVHSIHSTASTGHHFGSAPKITALESNLKHLKPFDSFSTINEEEEGSFRKFFTGHSSEKDKEESKKKFMTALNSAETELEKNPDDYAQSKNWESAKSKLMKKAEDNNYKGGLRVQRGGRDTRYYIVYDEGTSGFQKMASASSKEKSK